MVFTLATRDMNKIAIQSLLLGAQLMGLENVVVVQGDRLTERDLSRVRDASDYRPTELLGAIREMNQGIDFKGLKLRSPTDFCVGASLDLGRGIEREVQLAMRKVEAGAQFFISQPTFDPAGALELLDRYAEESGERLSAPVFFGVQVMTAGSPVFGDVPEWVTGWARQGSLRCGHSPGGARPVHSGRVPVVLSHSADSEGRQARLRSRSSCAGSLPAIGEWGGGFP